MSPAEHTPAPWIAEPSTTGREGYFGIMAASTHGLNYVTMIQPNPHIGADAATATANAHVIAAAPELLASLETIVKLIRWGTWGEGSGEMEEGELQLAEAAIAKALGVGAVAYVKEFSL